jgi:hypothetical protein
MTCEEDEIHGPENYNDDTETTNKDFNYRYETMLLKSLKGFKSVTS